MWDQNKPKEEVKAEEERKPRYIPPITKAYRL